MCVCVCAKRRWRREGEEKEKEMDEEDEACFPLPSPFSSLLPPLLPLLEVVSVHVKEAGGCLEEEGKMRSGLSCSCPVPGQGEDTRPK